MVSIFRIWAGIALSVFVLYGCSAGSGDASIDPVINSFELIDPTSGLNNGFGRQVAILHNGNIVVTSAFDNSSPPGTGAVHLFNPSTQAVIASHYGDTSEDDLIIGSDVIVLSNDNYVLVSPNTKENGLSRAGSVRLFDGDTGIQIGQKIIGDDEQDSLGAGVGGFLGKGVLALPNGNFVISTPNDNSNGLRAVGSIRLIDGSTGAQIGSTFLGNEAEDSLGSGGIYALANGNFVIASPFDDVVASSSSVLNSYVDAGSAILLDGATAAVIARFEGNAPNDEFGALGVTVLTNGRFVIASPVDDVNGVIDAGSIMLIDGDTGLQIGTTFSGDNTDDEIAEDGVLALPNGNYVVSSAGDDAGGFIDAGSVRLFSGVTGLPIGAAIVGDEIADRIGKGGLTALENSNFVISSPRDQQAGVQFGSVTLVSGVSGLQIGAKIFGDLENDFSSLTIISLRTNNFVIGATGDDENGIEDAGSVSLVDGTRGAIINMVAGDQVGDKLSFNAIVELKNNNFAIASVNDDVNGIQDAGSLRVLDGTTGVYIGSPIIGDNPMDSLGDQSIAPLSNGDFVAISGVDDQNGIVNAGSVMLVSGETGKLKEIFSGRYSEDVVSPTTFVFPAVQDSKKLQFFVLTLPTADNNGVVNSGRVILRRY